MPDISIAMAWFIVVTAISGMTAIIFLIIVAIVYVSFRIDNPQIKEKIMAETPVTLIDFLLTKTKVSELCAVYDSGYLVYCAYIDHEDLFMVPPTIAQCPVKNDRFSVLYVLNDVGEKQAIPCHRIDI